MGEARGHISFTEDFFIDAIASPARKCPVCCQITTSRSGYIGIMCDKCDYSHV